VSDSETNVLVPEQRRCAIRVLIVAESRIHFKDTSPIDGFSLTELIEKALRVTPRPWEELKITTARRLVANNPEFDPDDDKCADIPNFTFSRSLFGIDKYDQVWLFGDFGEEEETPLDQSELEVLSRFMNAGGGVFATGDHENLGYAMCGNVPRVRSMRKWCFKNCRSTDLKAPGKLDATRLDTLRQGVDPGFQGSDQSDNMPQEIRPKFFLEPAGTGAHPHPLLVDGQFAITVLPDHMHEGECVVPTDLGKQLKFNDYVFDEYPDVGATPVRMPPQSVALSISAGGRLLDQLDTLLPIEPRAFSPIVAYDGHQVLIDGKQLGRVVVDSSFHHFLDINLRGTTHPVTRGLYDSKRHPTSDYEVLKEYYRNIARFLCPPPLRLNYYRALLLDLRFRMPLVETLVPIPNPTPVDCISAGVLTEQALTQRYSRAETLQCVLALISTLHDELRRPLASLIDPWLPAPLAVGVNNPAVDFTVLIRLVLGAAIVGISSELPLVSSLVNNERDNGSDPQRNLAEVISLALSQSSHAQPQSESI
jgi:hypothetical protein